MAKFKRVSAVRFALVKWRGAFLLPSARAETFDAEILWQLRSASAAEPLTAAGWQRIYCLSDGSELVIRIPAVESPSARKDRKWALFLMKEGVLLSDLQQTLRNEKVLQGIAVWTMLKDSSHEAEFFEIQERDLDELITKIEKHLSSE